MSSAPKQGIQAQLEKHSLAEPQWDWAVVFDTTWTGPAILPAGSEWDYDMFLTRPAAEEQLRQPLTDRFRDPELWQRRNGTWEEAADRDTALSALAGEMLEAAATVLAEALQRKLMEHVNHPGSCDFCGRLGDGAATAVVMQRIDRRCGVEHAANLLARGIPGVPGE